MRAQYRRAIARLIAFLDRYDIRREAADRANARQGEATTCRIDMEMESGAINFAASTDQLR